MAHKAAEIAVKLAADGTIEKVDALFLVHDTDGDGDVQDVMRVGAHGKSGPRAFHAIIAAPHPESEAWVVAGANVSSPEAQARHQEERRLLGFDPIVHPELLSSNRATDKRDAKRVCQAIAGACGDGYEGWERCWMETPLDRLEQNGARAGLRDYTEQVERMILPLLGDDTPR